MTLMNEASDGIIPAVVALWRTMKAVQPKNDDELLALCAPATLARGSESHADNALRRWKQFGLFAADGSAELRLSPESKQIALDDLYSLQRHLRDLIWRRVTAETIEAELAKSNDDDEESADAKTGPEDFVVAASWALLQNPYTFPTSIGDVDRLRTEQGVRRTLFSKVSSGRWVGFQNWMRFLGLALMVHRHGLLINPAPAIRDAVRSHWKAGEEVPGQKFLEVVSDAVPVLPGGKFAELVRLAIQRPWREFKPDEVAPTVTLALLQLRHEGLLRWTSRSDAPTGLTLLGRGGVRREPLTDFIISESA